MWSFVLILRTVNVVKFGAGRHWIYVKSTLHDMHCCYFYTSNFNQAKLITISLSLSLFLSVCVSSTEFLFPFFFVLFCRRTIWYPVNSDFCVNIELSSFINIENERLIEMDQLVKPSSIQQQPAVMSQTKTMILQSTGNEFHYVSPPHLLTDAKGMPYITIAMWSSVAHKTIMSQ